MYYYSPKEGKINKERRKKKMAVSKKNKTQNRKRKLVFFVEEYEQFFKRIAKT